MNFNKAMIDLIHEIRRRSPSDIKPEIKLTNPAIFDTLILLFKTQKDTINQALIKELFELAGGPWPAYLKNDYAPEQRVITRVYRGQVQKIPVLDKPLEKMEQRKKPQKIYRGRVVAS